MAVVAMYDWQTALDSNNRVHAVFLDASKAFHRIHHGTLLSIITSTGAKQSALDWFQSYLSGRTICTRVLDALSPTGTVKSWSDPKDLFWDHHFFSFKLISKTFLPQLMLSQPSLPTTPCCTRRVAREAKTLHAVLYSLI